MQGEMIGNYLVDNYDAVDLNGDGKITRNEWMKACPCFDAGEEYKDI